MELECLPWEADCGLTAQRRTLGLHLPSGACRLFSLGLRWLLSHAPSAASAPRPSLLTSRETECVVGLRRRFRVAAEAHVGSSYHRLLFSPSFISPLTLFFFLFRCFFLSFRHSSYAHNLYLFSDGVSPCTCSPLYTSRFLSPSL